MFVALLALLAIVAFDNVAAASHRGQRTHAAPDRLTSSLAYGAVVWTVAAGLALLFVPTYRSTRSFGSNATFTTTGTITTHQTLLEHEGRSVLVVLATPVALAVVGAFGWPRFRRHLRIGTGALLALGCLASAASIGMFYLPAPLALIAAGLRTHPEGGSR